MLRVGIDYRPALQNREGIGRCTRELALALGRLSTGPELRLYGSTLASVRVPHDLPEGSRLSRWRLPTRAQRAWLGVAGGADGFLGGVDIFHHTQYQRLPVARAVEVATLYDVIFLDEAELVGPDTAQTLAARARTLAQHATRFLVPSAYVAERVAARLEIDPAAIHVTPLGCDHFAVPADRRPRASAPDDSYLLTVSRIEPRKNYLGMLRAFEQLVQAGLPQRWKIAGPAGHRSAEILAAIDHSPARARIDVLGEVPEARLRQLLCGADLFFFMSLSEGFGLPPLEAMVLGVPVLASDTTSVGEVCAGGARLVDPQDEEAVSAALCELAGDPAARAEWIVRGQRCAARFTWKRCAELTVAAFQGALPSDA